ncbi:pyridine nucleotide-disulfide oxidoreductase [Nocardioides gansuensis]|uniref:Pyridine nucleotide-disulfide oxidoreductase n=1 Tax=Nocardioides gansuensis TaxID=2138300 RepID=A0A2T8FFN9_9ACTN|nr:NAD(P)/FAD-dependent oxidoreductase [Nocardioides gansuensis]PVG84524.1 pyridine nucleotide-disulfide oxidoreductase [Nocardioides gansuensis]
MRVVVVGGGIAGPAVAMALHWNGVEAVVLEGRPRSDGREGSYLTVTPNGLDALEHMGALSLVRDAGFPARRNVMLGSRGQRLGEVGLGEPLHDGTHAVTVKRSLLSMCLAQEAERRGIPIEYDAPVAEVADHGSSARATLTDGRTFEGDLLIGADGVHSKVRRAIDPHAPSGRYVGLLNFGGITRDTHLAEELPEEAWEFRFAKRAFFGAARTPGRDVVWFVNLPGPEIDRAQRGAISPDAWHHQLAELFTGDPGPAAELIAAGKLELVADNVYDLGHVPTWHRGRLVVIGDAAHAPSPSSGQGASMALEDAALLTAALRRHPTVEDALARFVHQRRPRVERIVATGARTSSAKTPGPVGRVLRDAILRPVFRYAVTDKSMAWIYDHRIEEVAPARDDF